MGDRSTQPSDLLLAIDTSTADAGVALYDGRVRAEHVWSARRNHARQLMPTIRDVLEQLGRRPEDLAVVAAARGPGSFTGLRVGLAAAHGLAYALGLQLYGVGSLEVLAAGLAASPWPVRAVLDAGRGRFATALYRREGLGWVQAGPIVGVDLDGLLRLVNGADGDTLDGGPEHCAVVGDLTDQARDALAGLPSVWVASPAASVRRPAVLAELAWQAWRRGRRPGAEDGEPIYLARA